MSGLALRSLGDTHWESLPAVTVLVIRPNGWILACPFPWVVYSLVLTMRREVTPAAAFLFAGTMFLALTILVCAVFIACVIPFITLKA